uniref:Uncharacterized protein n=1 Tax=Proboscia inermis TaxID=420281 RepID=A0A7S0C6N6_9STRA
MKRSLNQLNPMAKLENDYNQYRNGERNRMEPNISNQIEKVTSPRNWRIDPASTVPAEATHPAKPILQSRQPNPIDRQRPSAHRIFLDRTCSTRHRFRRSLGSNRYTLDRRKI